MFGSQYAMAGVPRALNYSSKLPRFVRVMEGGQIGAYRVLHQLGGVGGMGAVWLAEHAMLERRTTLTVLHAELSSRPEIGTRSSNEARAAADISDPGIGTRF